MGRPFIVYLSINTPNLTSVFNFPPFNQSKTNGREKNRHLNLWALFLYFGLTQTKEKTIKIQYAFPIRICFMLTDNYWSFWWWRWRWREKFSKFIFCVICPLFRSWKLCRVYLSTWIVAIVKNSREPFKRKSVFFLFSHFVFM